MAAALFGRDEFLYSVAEEDDANLVVVLDGTESQCGGHFGHQLFFELVMGAETVGSAHVNQQHDRHLALLFKYLDIRVVQTGGHVPVDASDIVAILILAHFAECHAAPFEGTMVFARKQLPGKPAGFDFYFADLF